MPNSSSPDLVISPVHLKDAGFYICRVNSGGACEFSQWAQVDVLNVGMSHGKIVPWRACNGCSKYHLYFFWTMTSYSVTSPPFFHSNRAELSFLRWSAEVGDTSPVSAATCWWNPAAGVRSRGTAHPSIPVAQKRSPNPKLHKKKTHGDILLLLCLLLLLFELFFYLITHYKSWSESYKYMVSSPGLNIERVRFRFLMWCRIVMAGIAVRSAAALKECGPMKLTFW